MVEDSELNVLVCNVLNETHYSHCRLCLKEIQDQYVRLHDTVVLDPESGDFQTLTEVLTKLLGPGMREEIVGIDAVCTICADKALESFKFLQMCEKSQEKLNNVFNNLTNNLNADIDTNAAQTLYIAVSEYESQLIFIKNEGKKDPGTKMFQCTVCNEIFDDMLELRVHNITTHASSKSERREYIHQCPECDQYRCSEESLKKHQEQAHGEFVCKDCGKPCKGMDKLQIHEQKHISKSECPKCGKTYNTKGFFLKHVKLCLEDRLDPHPIRSKIKKTYFCDKCGKGYSTPGGLRVHNRFVHGNAKPHVCKFCNKQFTAPSYLKVHMVKHTGEKNFKCDLCSRQFVSKEALLYHTRRHTGDKPYSCTLCDEKFVNASARAEHIKFKHVGPTLMCEICSRKFFTPNFLKQHIKKHHDPSNKLYSGRSLIPPNVPAVENMRVRFID